MRLAEFIELMRGPMDKIWYTLRFSEGLTLKKLWIFSISYEFTFNCWYFLLFKFSAM